MIEKTLDKIRKAEEAAVKSIAEARKEARHRVSVFRDECDVQWEKTLSSLAGIEKEIIGRHEKEAQSEVLKLRDDVYVPGESPESLAGRIESAAVSIVDDLTG